MAVVEMEVMVVCGVVAEEVVVVVLISLMVGMVELMVEEVDIQ